MSLPYIRRMVEGPWGCPEKFQLNAGADVHTANTRSIWLMAERYRRQKAKNSLVYFDIVSHALGVIPCPVQCHIGFSLCFLLYFQVLGFTFHSLIHFERQGSSFIFLHVDIHFPQSHILNRLSFSQCIF